MILSVVEHRSRRKTCKHRRPCSDLAMLPLLQDSILQLFTIMFGDIQFSTLKTILSVNTVASRLAVFMAAIYAVLVLIVLVNLLIAM